MLQHRVDQVGVELLEVHRARGIFANVTFPGETHRYEIGVQSYRAAS